MLYRLEHPTCWFPSIAMETDYIVVTYLGSILSLLLLTNVHMLVVILFILHICIGPCKYIKYLKINILVCTGSRTLDLLQQRQKESSKLDITFG